MICDLHAHTTCSDGTLTPEELAALAKEVGLSAIAITDHNTTAGMERFRTTAEALGMEYSCGTEISTEWEGREIHLVGQFLHPDRWAEVSEHLERRNRLKEECNRLCIELLQRDGYDISYEEFRAKFPKQPRNRLHIIRVLMDKGVFQTPSEGFEKLFFHGSPYNLPLPRLNFLETVEFLVKIGAVPVVAHPLLTVEQEKMEEFLCQAKLHGAVGAEVQYSLYSPEETAFMTDLVYCCDLLPSGGSDFHGANKPAISLGVGMGNLAIPYEYYENLRAQSPYFGG